MGTTDHFVRQWQLLRKLSASGVRQSVKELAVEFAVSTKFIRRDLDSLASVGFPLEESIDPHCEKSWSIRAHEILNGLLVKLQAIVLQFEHPTRKYLWT
ncbi:HTH domain-containing protein [Gimesia panareensis]|uniref:HTH domain-containing protein n=1 Tax=Gimesia panareensis TaxID=2527978 RepID=UPI0011A43497|nr:HTH domain-containing protein [Gimesia panareensis]